MQPHRQHSEDNEAPFAGADDAVAATGPCDGASVSNAVRLPVVGGSTGILRTFAGLADNRTDHFTLTFAYAASPPPPLVRVHSSCMTGDILGSERCDCGPQLAEAKRRLMAEGGILIYLQQEGRGIGLAAKIAAYALQDRGLDTYEANRALGFSDDQRQYGVAAQMLKAQGVTQIRLLTNNPIKALQLRRCGIDVVAIEPTSVSVTAHNRRYLEAKRDKTGHTLALEPAEDTPSDESCS